jgi:amidase
MATKNELWTWSGVDLAAAIRTGDISSREAVQSCLDRLEAVNPTINAVVDVMAEEALAAADQADKVRRAGGKLGLLHGVPVTIKINVDYKGRATTGGVVAFANRIAQHDSTTVTNFRKAGAVIFGRTNVPAFSHRYFTDNDLHGRTLNPWDKDRSPGGSSGGAAAAVATGIGPIAHGNDRAGSVRHPAYCCGIPGLRPSFGRVPDYVPPGVEERGLTSQLTFAHGVLARHVRDVRIGFEALAAPERRDPWSVPVVTPADSKPGRVAMFLHEPSAEIDPAVPAAIRTAARWLEDAGYQVDEVAPPHFEEAASLFWTLLMTEERAASVEERASSTRIIEQFGDEAVKRVRRGTVAAAAQLDFNGYIKAIARRTTILREWLEFFEQYPLVLMPVCWQRPWIVDYDQGGDAVVKSMAVAHGPMLAVSLLGVPGMSVPTGLVDGVPMGVQLVAGRFQEHVILAAAEAIERRAAMPLPINPVFEAPAKKNASSTR